MFNKIIRPHRIYQDVANQLEEAVLTGKLKEGDRLPSERDLAETFNISRRTLRESLRVVEEKGLIEIRSNGTFARMATSKKLSQSLGLALRSKQIVWKDVAQFRSEMEGNIVDRAAKHATKEEVKELEKIIDKIQLLAEEKPLDWEAFLKFDSCLHLYLAEMMNNPIYSMILKTFLDNLMPFYDEFRSNENEFILENLENLKMIVLSIKRRDSLSARKAMFEHLEIGFGYLHEVSAFNNSTFKKS